MRDAGTVSVIIPTYQRAKMLGRCLNGFASQLRPGDEVILVNDGSTDETEAVAARFPFVRVLRQGNQGAPAAVNRGLAHASGEYVWKFDDDDLPLPGALNRMRSFLDEKQNVDFGVCTWSPATESAVGDSLEPFGSPFVLPDISERGALLPLLEMCFIGGSSMFARRYVYTELGGYNTAYPRGQDYHFAIRAALRFKFENISQEPAFLYSQDSHSRGSARDSYDPSLWQRRKWLNFDQQLYFELLHSLPIERFEEPGVHGEHSAGLAHVNKARVAASKILSVQTIDELLRRASRHPNALPDRAETLRLSSLVGLGAHYEVGTVEHDPVFLSGLRQLGQVSPAGQRMERIVMSAIAQRERARRLAWVRRARSSVRAVASRGPWNSY